MLENVLVAARSMEQSVGNHTNNLMLKILFVHVCPALFRALVKQEGCCYPQVYVCVAFLLNWSKELQQQEFQDMIIFLQRLPTSDWSEQQIGVVLSHAHMYRTSFEKARSHLQ